MSNGAMLRLSRRTLLGAGLASFVGGCSSDRPLVDRLVVAGGERGGFYLEFAQLLATQLRAAKVARTVEVRSTEGSLQNLELLRLRQADLAICLADAAAQSREVVALGRVYENYLQCVVRAAGPARQLSDLVGKRVSAGPPGAGAALTTNRLLSAAGMHAERAPVIANLHLSDAADALAAGRIDAMFWSGGVPTRRLSDLSAQVPIRLLPLDRWLAPLRTTYGVVYQRAQIPAGTYSGAEQVSTIGVPNLLICRPEVPRAVASKIVDVLVNRAAGLVPAAAVGAHYLDPNSLIGTSPLKLHPGAADRYRTVHG
ncbi:TAXI family TRAP transporter solute-binding subunit [Kribbella speibonae]|uniref:TAXI family TRAP transporter solute-binding subunit n=1 Tax=Kribbella speibonae TaxID=1572660 RepID=UPI00192D8460|nr:TAXI family TRAP transporter solute-binding subunit [Kribbella speibonae]